MLISPTHTKGVKVRPDQTDEIVARFKCQPQVEGGPGALRYCNGGGLQGVRGKGNWEKGWLGMDQMIRSGEMRVHV